MKCLTSSARVLFLTLAASTLSVAGCHDGTQSWSTKGESIYDGTPPQLNVGERTIDPDLLEDLHGEDVPEEAANSLRSVAIDLLAQASTASDPMLRANAIEAMHYAPDRLDEFVQKGLADENRGVRFIAAMTLGKFEMNELAHLAHPLLEDPSPSVQAAAMYALRRCGEPVDLTPLRDMLSSSSPEVKANAALVLGELGNPSAVPMLRSAVGRGMTRVSTARAQVVDLQLAEAMVRLGDERQLEVIRATLFAPPEQGEMVALACQIVGRLRDARAVPNLQQLATREGNRQLPAEVRMAATMALAEIDHGSAPVEVPLEYARSRQPQLRAQAALTLGAINATRSMPALHRLLEDDHPVVQVYAAGGILRHLAG